MKRIIFGKKYTRMRSKDKKIKLLEKNMYILSACVILAFTIIIFLMTNTMKVHTFILESHIYEETVIYMDELTQEQQDHVESILQQIKPLYFQSTKTITFVNELEGDLAGQNIVAYGDIIIEYSEIDNLLKERICHEMMHNFLRIDDNTHRIVYDLGRQQVCFK